ncbi:MAG: hypothetical protein LBP67_05200 [Bacteroidales bacterium]|jgi:hypothetical protein|nr:hypothetical protein [Bacteroidales bacterium]
MAKITLTIADLENLLIEAKEHHKKFESHTNSTIEIAVKKATDIHGKSDKVEAYLQSAWAECNSHYFFKN